MLRPADEANGESYIHSRPSDIGYRRTTINWFRIHEWSSPCLSNSQHEFTHQRNGNERRVPT